MCFSGYWAFSFASGVQEFTVQENLPSFVPAMMSTMSDEMSFIQRVWNMVTKLTSKAFMLYHASIVGEFKSLLESVRGALQRFKVSLGFCQYNIIRQHII